MDFAGHKTWVREVGKKEGSGGLFGLFGKGSDKSKGCANTRHPRIAESPKLCTSGMKMPLHSKHASQELPKQGHVQMLVLFRARA